MSKTTHKKSKQKELTLMEQALLVSRRVQLEDVRLIKSQSYMKPEALQGQKEFKMTSTTRALPDKERSSILVFVNFRFKCFGVGKADTQIIGIVSEFVLTYTISSFDGLTDDGIKEFANLNGVFNAWPYWREFIQNTIARMNLPPLTIPVYRLSSPSKKRKSAKRKKLTHLPTTSRSKLTKAKKAKKAKP